MVLVVSDADSLYGVQRNLNAALSLDILFPEMGVRGQHGGGGGIHILLYCFCVVVAAAAAAAVVVVRSSAIGVSFYWITLIRPSLDPRTHPTTHRTARHADLQKKKNWGKIMH